jgi:hypothetical protein
MKMLWNNFFIERNNLIATRASLRELVEKVFNENFIAVA